jgi:DNA replication protein DnaC
VLASLDFIESGLNVCVLGPSDSGKSYLAKALGISVCTKYRVIYCHCEQFLESMVMLKEKDYPKYQKQMMFLPTQF